MNSIHKFILTAKLAFIILAIVFTGASMPRITKRVAPDAVIMPIRVEQLTVEELIYRNLKERSCRWVWVDEVAV